MADATALAAPEAAAQAGRGRRVLASFARNRLAVAGVIVLAIVMISALLAPWVSPYDPLKMDLVNPYAPPGSPGHALGTDNFGRDILARLIHGSRISLLIGVVVVSIAASFGTVLGLLAGYLGGWVDEVVMRAVEIFYAFPFLVLAIAVIAVFGPSIFNVMWVLGLVSWPLYARLVRAQVLALHDVEYVEAARASGMSRSRVMFRHVLPNVLTPVIVTATFGIPQAILASAALGFLGLGVQPPTPEWGVMIAEGKDFIRRAPNLITWPGLAIMTVVLGFNFVGDGLRDALDPRNKGG
ncbi:MAG TPA: ABC transporter permease [Trueperaceae bacterium]|nr:ABC transporter permease [Trueperaceae bacterium]